MPFSDCPVNLSAITLADSTVPCSANIACSRFPPSNLSLFLLPREPERGGDFPHWAITPNYAIVHIRLFSAS
jgi:hypothetical protein